MGKKDESVKKRKKEKGIIGLLQRDVKGNGVVLAAFLRLFQSSVFYHSPRQSSVLSPAEKGKKREKVRERERV